MPRRKPAGDLKLASHHCGIVAINREINIFENHEFLRPLRWFGGMVGNHVADIVARYAVGGVHLDYVRYPNEEFDYSRESLLAFRTDIAGMLSEPDLARVGSRGVLDWWVQ